MMMMMMMMIDDDDDDDDDDDLVFDLYLYYKHYYVFCRNYGMVM